ncbi:MAG: hypothetical protein WB566_15365, partial [Terriglobales bacterium]
MDTQTRHALKQDKFRAATASSVSWLSGHRSGVLRWVISGAAVVVLVVGALVFWNLQTGAADKALGAAVDLYAMPLTQPGAPPEKNAYSNAADRAKEANRQFVAVAKDFGWLPESAKAHYFAGVTY